MPGPSRMSTHVVLQTALLASLLLVSHTARADVPQGTGRGRIDGRITLGDSKRPVAGAVLCAISLNTGSVVRSGPADTGGHYSLAGLPYGYYLFAIESEGRLYAVARSTNLSPGLRQTLDFGLGSAPAAHEGASPEEGIMVPILGRRAAATAEIEGRVRRPFLKTPLGVVTLVGGSLLFLRVL